MAKKETKKEAKQEKEHSEESLHYTKYEKARMVGSRALQISMGAPFLLTLSEKDLEKIKYSPIEIALREYEEGILPITIKRPEIRVRAK